MKCVIIGDIEIRALAVARGAHAFVSAVAVVQKCESQRAIESRHVWDEPLFETETEALHFAWRRATLMASALRRPGRSADQRNVTVHDC